MNFGQNWGGGTFDPWTVWRSLFGATPNSPFSAFAAGGDNPFAGLINQFASSFAQAPQAPGSGEFAAWIKDQAEQLQRMYSAGDGNWFGIDPASKMAPSDFAELFNLPPLGASREWELARRKIVAAYAEQQKAAGALARQIGRVYTTALQTFARSINANDGRDPITSMRALYDLWVDIAEAAYSERVMTEEYAKVFGKFVNTTAELQGVCQEVRDDFNELLNLPSRREFDTLIKRQEAFRSEIEEIKSRLSQDFDVAIFERRLDALEQRFETGLRNRASRHRSESPKTRATVTKRNEKKSTKPKRKAQGPARKATKSSSRGGNSDEFDIGAFGSTGRH